MIDSHRFENYSLPINHFGFHASQLSHLKESHLEIVSALNPNQKSFFKSYNQANSYRQLLFLLKNGSDGILLQFVDHIVANYSGASFEREHYLLCLQNLIRFFFVRIDDEDWVNCHQIRLIVEHCIKKAVQKANTAEAVFENEVLNMIFAELCQHQSSK